MQYKDTDVVQDFNITNIEVWLVNRCNQLADRLHEGLALFERTKQDGQEVPLEWHLLWEALKKERFNYLLRLVRVYPHHLDALSREEQSALRQQLNYLAQNPSTLAVS